jgi:hypothetical protein
LFEKVGDHIHQLDNFRAFKPQAPSNIVWAYATSRMQHLVLFKRTGDHVASDNLKLYHHQAISNIVWEYAAAKVQHPALFNKVGDYLVSLENLKSFNPQSLINVVYGHTGLQECVILDYLRKLETTSLLTT